MGEPHRHPVRALHNPLLLFRVSYRGLQGVAPLFGKYGGHDLTWGRQPVGSVLGGILRGVQGRYVYFPVVASLRVDASRVYFIRAPEV